MSGTGCDISEEALKVAKENDSRLQTGAVFIQGDLFENIAETYDMIVSNPPYIRTEEISSLEDEVKLHDPWIALDGKKDGLYFYRLIVKESVKHIKKVDIFCLRPVLIRERMYRFSWKNRDMKKSR